MSNVTDAKQEGAQQTAQDINITAAKAVGELVRSTLGPMGMDKMLVDNSGRITVTNDGATILRETNVTHPTARMIIQVAKTQEAECYDGTTTAVIIAGELMKQSEALLNKGIHATMIVRGFKKAAKKALAHLDDIVLTDDIHGALSQKGRLVAVAMTAMTGKSADEDKEHLAEMAVKAVNGAAPNMVNVVVRPGNSITESFVVNGVIIDKAKVNHAMPDGIKDARIAIIASELTLPNMTGGVKVQFSSGDEADAYMEKRKKQLLAMGDHLIGIGANVVLCLADIDEILHEHLARAGVFAARRVASSDLERVAEATDGMIVSNLNDLEPTDLGKCTSVKQVEYESSERPLILFEECPNNEVASIMVFAPTEHLAFEIGRAVDDALGVVHLAKDDALVTGGGSTFMEMSLIVKEYATTVGGRAQMAVEAYGNALEIIPSTLAENSGLSPVDALIDLRAAHAKGNPHAFLDLEVGGVGGGAWDVIEPKKVVATAVQSATDVACMILRIDNIITAKEPEDPFEGM